jgi:hypothetical protein
VKIDRKNLQTAKKIPASRREMNVTLFGREIMAMMYGLSILT